MITDTDIVDLVNRTVQESNSRENVRMEVQNAAIDKFDLTTKEVRELKPVLDAYTQRAMGLKISTRVSNLGKMAIATLVNDLADSDSSDLLESDNEIEHWPPVFDSPDTFVDFDLLADTDED